VIHLRTITIPPSRPAGRDGFPFNLPALAGLEELTLTAPLTFLVGENGSGKSTFLEAIACAARSITVGSDDAHRDQTLEPVRRLARQLKLTWNRRTHRGFFLRAEDFFGYARRLDQMRAALERELQTVDDEYAGRSQKAVDLAKMPYRRELADLQARYGAGLDARSHGESFLTLFQSRFVPGGLYLLDEPEAPLSPLRQVGLIALLREMVEQDAQFIIATHSPILMAYPGATILNFDAAPLQAIDYEDLEHVTLTRSFLNNPGQYLHHLANWEDTP
jgi:predicted ATPase